jgi:hypothetical protein
VIDLGRLIIPRLMVAGILWTLVIDLGKIIIPRLRVAGILWTLVIDLGKIIHVRTHHLTLTILIRY